MDGTQLPFNRLVGLETSTGDLLVSLQAGPQHGNHLGTVHASALLAVAEAGAGVSGTAAGAHRGFRSGGAASGGQVPQACSRFHRGPSRGSF